jgi:hypothetical protein
MRYNQPYDQPSDPNAPYVDGDPDAGIEGSIVPGAGIEFDQREVVEVINAAFTRHYTDFTNTACAAPDNGDLTQLRKAIEGFIRTTPVPSWYIDNVVNYTVHGTSPKYANLNVAFEDLSKYIVTHNGQVTLAIAAGAWPYGGASVSLDHPNGNRIIVTGANLSSYPVATDFTVTGYTDTLRGNDRTNTLNRLRTRFTTELDFTGGAGISSSAVNMLLQNILIVGDRSAKGGFGLSAGSLTIKNVSVWGGYVGVGQGILSLASGSFFSANGSIGHGIGLASGGNMWHGTNTQMWLTSNDNSGIGAGFDCGANGYAQVFANGNAWEGLACTIIGQFQVGAQSQFNMNAQQGLFVCQGSFYADPATGGAGNGLQVQNNGGGGMWVTVGSNAQAPWGQFSGNTGGPAITCIDGSFVYAPSASGVAGNSNPGINTLSADGSYITV